MLRGKLALGNCQGSLITLITSLEDTVQEGQLWYLMVKVVTGMPTQAMQGSLTPLDLWDLTDDLNPMSLVECICIITFFF